MSLRHFRCYYLLAVDLYSRLLEVAKLTDITTLNKVKFLESICVRFGYPEILVSDNAKSFKNFSFQDYCEQHGIRHIFTPPYYPQLNGQVKRFVDTFKRTLYKCIKEKKKSSNCKCFKIVQNYC